MHYRKFLTILFSFFFLLGMFGQEPGKRLYIAWLKEANRLYDLDAPNEKTDSAALQLFMKVSDATAGTADEAAAIESLIKAGNIHQGHQRFPEANSLYHQALVLTDNLPNKAPFHYEAWLYLGSSMYFSNVLDSAQLYFEKASHLAAAYTQKEKLPEQDRLYNSLGAIYFEAANYQQARNYFQKALDFSVTSATDYIEMYNGIRSNIANCLMKLNRYDSALTILTSLRPSEYQADLIKQNTAHCLFELGRYDSALSLYQSLPLKEGYSTVVALTDMGRIYMQKKEWQKAEAVFDTAIAYNKKFSHSIRNKEEALAYLYRARLASEQGLPDEALSWTNESLRELHEDFNPSDPYDLPEKISESVSPITSFQVLHAKAKFLKHKFRRYGQVPALFASLRAYRKALETAQFIRMNFDNDEATLFFNTNNREIYSEAIELAYEAYERDDKLADEFLFILESYKGNVLYQNFRNLSIRSRAGIDESLLNKERDIRRMIGIYTSRLNQSREMTDAKQLQKRILDLQVELSRLQKSFDSDPTYAFYKYQQLRQSFTLDHIRSLLDRNTAILNYFLTDSLVYCLVVSRDAQTIRKIPVSSAFASDLNHFIRETYHPREGARYEGYGAAAGLYAQLVKPLEHAVSRSQRWVIIPDGKLYLIPFDALIKTESKREFLLQSKNISYHYSISLLLEAEKNPEGAAEKQVALGFAPFAEKDSLILKSGLPVLPESIREIREIGGITYSGRQATREQFLHAAPRHNLIHLATHASVGQDSSSNWVQFFPEDQEPARSRLPVHEIYNLDLHHAKLVVLSACETGGGMQAGGEGLLSLSRAFLYAGADGVISTLWKTEDKVTAYIMQKLHYYMKKGHGAEQALTMAKRDLLQYQELGARYTSPAYWANFIYMGKQQEFTRENDWSTTIGWVIAFILVFVALLVLKKRKAAAI